MKKYLSKRGFALEEICVFAAFRWVESWIQERAAIGYGLQGGGSFVREGQSDKQLENKQRFAKKCMKQTIQHQTT